MTYNVGSCPLCNNREYRPGNLWLCALQLLHQYPIVLGQLRWSPPFSCRLLSKSYDCVVMLKEISCCCAFLSHFRTHSFSVFNISFSSWPNASVCLFFRFEHRGVAFISHLYTDTYRGTIDNTVVM